MVATAIQIPVMSTSGTRAGSRNAATFRPQTTRMRTPLKAAVRAPRSSEKSRRAHQNGQGPAGLRAYSAAVPRVFSANRRYRRLNIDPMRKASMKMPAAMSSNQSTCESTVYSSSTWRS